MSDSGALKELNLHFASFDNDVEHVVTTNTGTMKINIMLVPRWETDFGKAKPLFLTYNKDVTSFYLEDNLNSIGVSGSIDVRNESSHLEIFLGKNDDYFVVINISEFIMGKDGKEEPLYRYEPYIFVITAIETLTPADTDNKVLRIKMEDYITNIMKTHSFNCLLKHAPQIMEVKNYKDFFDIALTYVKEYIKINSNQEYEYRKDLIYKSDMTLKGNVYNGNDTDNDMSALIMQSFSKIDPDSSIYEALIVMMSDCCTTIKTPGNFSSNNQMVGDVLIPFFFKEEYGDRFGFYFDNWGTGEDEVLLTKNGQPCPLLFRNMTMRDVFMPYYAAFSTPNKCCIYETINPDSDKSKEANFFPLNGFYQQELASLQYVPMSVPLLKKMKKNLIFVDGNIGGGASGAASIIFYSWLFDYYTSVFLKTDTMTEGLNLSEYRIPNLVPSFHLMQRTKNIQHASSEDNSFQNMFDEMNSFTMYTETEDSLNECMRAIGKNVGAFMLGNESYNVRIRGNLLRRPNEIIKFCYRGNKDGSQQTLSMQPNLGLGDYTFLYVKRVGHYFRGKEYWNDISACKIAEIFQK